MSPMDEFYKAKAANMHALGRDSDLCAVTRDWFARASKHRYSYHFSWLGVPIIQFPQDLVALQEVIWKVRPDCIIETGVAHGGSLIFYASLLAAMGSDARVIGIDIEIRPHNREAIEEHLLSSRIDLIVGSSTVTSTFDAVVAKAGGSTNPLVILDSNHAYAHVSAELDLYSKLIRKDSYLVVLDTVVDDMPQSFSTDRPWGPNNGPKRAVREFLGRNDRFVIDEDYNSKLLITVAPDGYLRCVKNP